jgi:hypothetical protein
VLFFVETIRGESAKESDERITTPDSDERGGGEWGGGGGGGGGGGTFRERISNGPS